MDFSSWEDTRKDNDAQRGVQLNLNLSKVWWHVWLPVLEEIQAHARVCWKIFRKCNPSPCNPDFLISELPASKGMPPPFSQPLKWASIKRPSTQPWTCCWQSQILWSGFPCVLSPPHVPTLPSSWRLSEPDDVTVQGLKPPHGAWVFLTAQAKWNSRKPCHRWLSATKLSHDSYRRHTEELSSGKGSQMMHMFTIVLEGQKKSKVMESLFLAPGCEKIGGWSD